MPELPEVETVVRGIRSEVIGLKITSAFLAPVKLRSKLLEDFSGKIVGKSIAAISRRGKYIIVNLKEGASIVLHLGMSGRLLLGNDVFSKKHDHAIFSLSDGRNIVFNDPRRFGAVIYTEADPMDLEILRVHGVEPLTDAFDQDFLYGVLTHLKAPIKSVIMNARIITGVGNIYACESLFDAGIDPFKVACDLSKPMVGKLVLAIKDTLNRAIDSGGSTLRDYKHLNGDVGKFQHSFKVYGRKDMLCLTCDRKIKMEKMAGRATYYCPNCQN